MWQVNARGGAKFESGHDHAAVEVHCTWCFGGGRICIGQRHRAKACLGGGGGDVYVCVAELLSILDWPDCSDHLPVRLGGKPQSAVWLARVVQDGPEGVTSTAERNCDGARGYGVSSRGIKGFLCGSDAATEEGAAKDEACCRSSAVKEASQIS